MNQVEWTGHPLGPPEQWPRELRAFLFMILVSPAPKAVLWGPDLFVFWNDACSRKFLGPQHLEKLGQPFSELLPEQWPVLGDHVRAALTGEGQLLEAIETTNPASGRPETVKVCYTPIIGHDGDVVGVLADLYDMTPVVRRERQLVGENEMLLKLFASAPVLIAYMSVPDYHIRFANRAIKDFFGGRPLEGSTVAEAAPELEEQGFIGVLDEVTQTGKAFTGVNHPVMLNGDPEPRYVSFIYQPLLDDDGQVTHILCSGSDVTEGKLAHDLAAQLRHELLHASRLSAMSTMAMTLAHELNQPLCASASYLAAAQRFFDSGDETHALLMRESFEEAAREIQRAGEIVRRARSLVTFGRSEAAVASVRECVGNAVKLLLASGDLQDLSVDLEISADQVLADRIQVEQVLVNLLRNAAQASAGCERREAQVTAVRKGDMVEVSVRDWGSGLPSGEAAALFDAFGRVSSNGLGIGLSLCRTIIEAQGGQIGAYDNGDHGACFYFTLPAVGCMPKAAIQPAAALPA